MLVTLVTQKVRLKNDHAQGSKKGSHTGICKRTTLGDLKKDHTQIFFCLDLNL